MVLFCGISDESGLICNFSRNGRVRGKPIGCVRVNNGINYLEIYYLYVYWIISLFLKDSRFINFNLGLLKSCLSYRRLLWCYKGVGGAVSADLWGVNGVYFSSKLGDVVQTFASLKSNRNKSSAFNCYTSLISLNQPSISHPYLHYSDLNAKSSA